ARNNFSRTETPQAFFDPLDPTGAVISGTRIDNYELGLGIPKRLVTGGTVNFELNRDFSRFHPGVFPLNPQTSSSATLSLTPPLRQGAGIDVNLAPIVIARINTERSYFQFKESVQALVSGVIDAYWNVVFARTDVWARREQVVQGEFAFKLAEARVRTGLGTAG